MHTLTNFDGQFFRVAGHYVLVSSGNSGGPPEAAPFARLADLALALAHRWRTRCRAQGVLGPEYHTLGALSTNGKILALDELVAYGRRLYREGRQRRRTPDAGYVRRKGPVSGIRCFRGGHRQFRHFSTTPERRLNNLVVVEDNEVAARLARLNLPNSYDDFARTRERSWKAQRKGRKAWDRTEHGQQGQGRQL